MQSYLKPYPLIAILRGVQNHEALEIAQVLYELGLRCIEVPLNSPNALESLRLIAKHLPSDCLVGAGTVLEAAQVAQVLDAGGQLIVMPHSDSAVICAAKAAGLFCVPGVATISEAFSALKHGADALKLFPASSVAPAALSAWRDVLPKPNLCFPVGGIAPEQMAAYFQAGAAGFGLGGGLYKPGMSAQDVKIRAELYINELKLIQKY